MGKAAQRIFDQSIRRQIHVGRFSASLGMDAIRLLRTSEQNILARLAGNELTDFGRKRFVNMLAGIQQINQDVYKEIHKRISSNLRQFTKDELRFHTKSIQRAYPIKLMLNRPSAGQVYAAAIARPFEGAILKDWMSNIAESNFRKLDSAIKMGFVEGETIGQIVRAAKGVLKTSRRGLTALVRTAVNHTSQVARENLYAANKEIFKGIQIVATLDGRTTPICQAQDGRKYPMDEGPRPPFHWACRTTTIPITKSWKELGFDDLKENDKLSKRPFVVDKRRVADIPKGERNIGITSSKETYPKWLKRQPKAFIQNVLGKTRANLFIDGTVTVKRFIDSTGALYTLDELRKREDLTLEEISTVVKK